MAASLAGGAVISFTPLLTPLLFSILWSCVKGLMVMLDSVEMAASLAGGGAISFTPPPF